MLAEVPAKVGKNEVGFYSKEKLSILQASNDLLGRGQGLIRVANALCLCRLSV